MKIHYVTDDGKTFTDRDKAVEHETFINAEKAKEAAAKEIRNKRRQEVLKARQKYDELYDKYVKDYGKEEDLRYCVDIDDEFSTNLAKSLHDLLSMM